MNVGEWLKARGRAYPLPDCDDGSISMEAFERARLPMVVSCANCTMTMALTPERPCADDGRVFCSADCAEGAASDFDPISRRFRVTTTYAARTAHGMGGRLNRQSFFATADDARAFAASQSRARIHEAVNGETWQRNGKWLRLCK